MKDEKIYSGHYYLQYENKKTSSVIETMGLVFKVVTAACCWGYEEKEVKTERWVPAGDMSFSLRATDTAGFYH